MSWAAPRFFGPLLVRVASAIVTITILRYYVCYDSSEVLTRIKCETAATLPKQAQSGQA
jgi:hypothetical protein